jgi:hypothetical protein
LAPAHSGIVFEIERLALISESEITKSYGRVKSILAIHTRVQKLHTTVSPLKACLRDMISKPDQPSVVAFADSPVKVDLNHLIHSRLPHPTDNKDR